MRCAVLAAVILLLGQAMTAQAADWPQLGGGPQRTGYTTDTVKPPFRLAWYHNFQPERVARDVQAVIYAGKVLVGTKSGSLYALSATTGQQAWRFACGSPILHTAACGDGKVVVAALDGVVYAVHADTGALAWRFLGEADLGFSAAPLIAQNTVYIGQRGGRFYALDLRDGRLRWSFDAGAPILNSSAYDGGRVFFCDEALYVHCLDATTGREIWTSDQLYGQSAKQYYPVVYQGLVTIRPMMASPSSEYYNSNWGKDPQKRLDYAFQAMWPGQERYRAFLNWWYGRVPTLEVPDVPSNQAASHYAYYLHWLADRANAAALRAGPLPEVLLDAQDAVVAYFRQRPYEQDMFALDEETGRQAFIAPHFPSVHSLPGNAPPVAADGRGGVIIPWIFASHCWARLDLAKHRVTDIYPTPAVTNADETLNVSVGGNLLFIMHCEEANANYTGIFDLDRKRFYDLPSVPNRWGELSDNCESGNNAAAIANGYFYHIVFHQLAAWTSAEGGQQ